MKKITLLFMVVAGWFAGRAQLANGSIAPDFTYSDINGNVHHLYDYLNAGNSVYIDIFAAHCPTCWAYHQGQHMKTLYEKHGPAGTVSQDVIVLAVEHDPNNTNNEMYGISGNTQGNWDQGYPIINPEGADRIEFNVNYDAVYYPMIYAICPNKIITLIGPVDSTQLYAHVAECATIGIPADPTQTYALYYNGNGELIYSGLQHTATLHITDVSGRTVFTTSLTNGNGTIAVHELTSGIFIYTILQNEKTVTGKFFK
jgi:hypothetical protein